MEHEKRKVLPLTSIRGSESIRKMAAVVWEVNRNYALIGHEGLTEVEMVQIVS